MQFPDFGNYPKYDDIWSTPGVKAAIDIGTNTVLLLVADVKSDGIVIPLHEEQRFPRLGRGVDIGKNLQMGRMEAVITDLHHYRNVIQDNFGEISVIVTATSAVRDASNKMEFLWMTEEATGYRVRLLSGEEEAECAYLGAVSQLEQVSADSQYLTIDIGGGSTELSYKASGIISGSSLDMGSVRYTERFFKSETKSKDSINECQQAIRTELESLKWSKMPGQTLVGVAGTATTVASLLLELTTYEPQKLNGFVVNRGELQNLIDNLAEKCTDEILDINPVVLAGRADIILAGCLILQEVMQFFGEEQLVVSTGGIRHGALLKPLYS